MQMPKPTDADRQFFRSVVPEVAGVEVKSVFGNLGAFVNGNMFAGLFGSSIGVKLAADDLVELATIEGAGPFGPAERPMGGYLSLPSSFTEQATLWVSKAQAYVATLPPKLKKKN